MKQTSTKQHFNTILALSVFTGLFAAQPVFAEGKPFRIYGLTANKPEEDKPAKKNKIKAAARTFSSLNNNAVKIYPDILKRDMHVVAKENDGREIDFVVFDVEGTLVQHYKMKEKDHYRIAGLSRGTYVYRVFSGDEETATGKFEIR
ncbi:MAG: T9SS type A sorting domain-containing protein [Chitinophagaceae bacterium]|nr:T9SS type A sorting domain-containing protein [Chitinophagaceae bacterium]